jgi:hypothetical protein
MSCLCPPVHRVHGRLGKFLARCRTGAVERRVIGRNHKLTPVAFGSFSKAAIHFDVDLVAQVQQESNQGGVDFAGQSRCDGVGLVAHAQSGVEDPGSSCLGHALRPLEGTRDHHRPTDVAHRDLDAEADLTPCEAGFATGEVA